MPNQNIKCDKKLNRLHEEHINTQKTNAKTSWHNANKQQFVNLHIISGSATSVNRISPVFMEKTTTSSSKYRATNQHSIRFLDNAHSPIKEHNSRRWNHSYYNSSTIHHSQQHQANTIQLKAPNGLSETWPGSVWSPFWEGDPCQDRTDSAWAHY